MKYMIYLIHYFKNQTCMHFRITEKAANYYQSIIWI